MLDEPKSQPSSSNPLDDSGSYDDRTFEEYRAYLMSPEFTRRMSEHFQRATRRAIEEGRKLESEIRARTNP
jgi:hypothetical protein